MTLTFARLPAGITSFFDDRRQMRSVDPDTFKRACHTVASVGHGSVEALDTFPLARSFYRATIVTPDERATVLCNSTHPLLAFVHDGDALDFSFFDSVNLGPAFVSLADLQVLDAAWLASDLAEAVMVDLTPAELRQVMYWRPQRIGDLIFNHWD